MEACISSRNRRETHEKLFISWPLSYAAMKERSRFAKNDRTYDAEGFTRRAGCLCFKTNREEQVSVRFIDVLALRTVYAGITSLSGKPNNVAKDINKVLRKFQLKCSINESVLDFIEVEQADTSTPCYQCLTTY